jgi:hypothetical protein
MAKDDQPDGHRPEPVEGREMPARENIGEGWWSDTLHARTLGQTARPQERGSDTKKPLRRQRLLAESSRGGTRTPDPVINSHLLYQLSYSGRLIFCNDFYNDLTGFSGQ